MSKKENTFGAESELHEDDASFFDETEGRSLSREMKIGAGVILLLVAVLAVVLVGRLRGSSETGKPTAQGAATPKPDGTSNGKPGSQASTTTSGKPTMLAVTSDTRRAPSPSPTTDLFPPDNSFAKTGGSASGPPSFMPPKNPPSAYSAGYGSTKPGGGGTGATSDGAGFSSAGDRHPPRNPYRDPAPPTGGSAIASNSLNQVPLSLDPPGPAASVPGISGAGPKIPSPSEADFRGASAATAGPYGSNYSGSVGQGHHSGPPPIGSAYGSPPPVSSLAGNSPYERLPDRGPNGDRQPDPARTRPSAAPNPGSAGPDYPSSLQPSMGSPPPHPRPDRGQVGGRTLPRGNETTYVIQPNDSYSTISKKLYGSDAYYKALAEHNLKNWPDPNSLQVGGSLSTPTIEELAAKYPDLCPKPEHVAAAANRARMAGTSGRYGGGRTYVVQEGDSLFDIAKYELGKASRWVEIYDLNRDVVGTSFNYLTPGMKLALPENR